MCKKIHSHRFIIFITQKKFSQPTSRQNRNHVKNIIEEAVRIFPSEYRPNSFICYSNSPSLFRLLAKGRRLNKQIIYKRK